jgi:hypothetical protein
MFQKFRDCGLMLLIILTITLLSLAIFLGSRAVKKFSSQKRLSNGDLVGVILSLDKRELDELFKLYAREFGPGAARYARRTYAKWKSGRVRPSNKTFNRFLVHLPTVMSFDLKCEVLRRLREELCSKDDYRLSVDTAGWRESLAPIIEEIINRAYTAELPAQVQERLDWLADHDARVARAIIARSQVEASRNTVSLLEREIYNIDRLLRDVDGEGKITHAIKLPYGTVTLTIRRR